MLGSVDELPQLQGWISSGVHICGGFVKCKDAKFLRALGNAVPMVVVRKFSVWVVIFWSIQ